MPALFNYKRCDGFYGCAQPQDCEGVKVCPTGAIRHAFKKNAKIPTIDLSKCIDCGKCKNVCPAGVILYYETEEQRKKFEKEIEEDDTTPEEIWKQRYGVQPNKECSVLTSQNIDSINEGLHTVDFWDEEHLMCRINAIKIEDLPMKGIQFHKVSLDAFPEFREKFNLKLIPSMLFFRNGKEIGRIEGDLDDSLLEEVKERVSKILRN